MKKLFMAMFLLASVAGCSGARVAVPDLEGTPLVASELVEKSPSSFFKTAPASFKALLGAEIATGSQKQSLRYAVSKNQESIQIEVFPTTSFYTLLLFKSDGKTYSLQNTTDGSNESGKVTENTLRDIFGISLTVEELHAALFGTYQGLADDWQVVAHQGVDTGDVVQIKSVPNKTGSKSRQLYAELSIDLKTLQRVLFLDDDGDTQIVVTYQSYFENQSQPRVIALFIPEYKTNITLTIKKITK